MSMQFSVKVRNARADAIETQIGTSPTIEFIDAVPPANCGTANTANILATGTLPADWATAAAAGVLAKNGTWQATGGAAGTIRGFRIYRAGSPSECDIQGTVGPTGSPSYDMSVDNVVVAPAQVITITGFNITEGNV